jgi:hypothetical protein
MLHRTVIFKGGGVNSRVLHVHRLAIEDACPLEEHARRAAACLSSIVDRSGNFTMALMARPWDGLYYSPPPACL